jgi:hypothetical protein
MVGGGLLTSCHVLNRVPNKNKDQTPYEMWTGRKPLLSYCTLGDAWQKVNVPIPKKRKLGPKILDCVFLGYAQRSIAYGYGYAYAISILFLLMWVGIYLYLSNQVLIKFDQLKLFIAVSQSAFSCFWPSYHIIPNTF